MKDSDSLYAIFTLTPWCSTTSPFDQLCIHVSAMIQQLSHQPALNSVWNDELTAGEQVAHTRVCMPF
jgi:hypothetical protein